jgi:hypothetical protein
MVDGWLFGSARNAAGEMVGSAFEHEAVPAPALLHHCQT